jgi:sugar phosphate isomerase/epimerase
VVEQGISDIQFNMISAGLPSMPDAVDPATVARIRAAMDARKLRMASLSGTFNMIHPDPTVREAGLTSLRVLAQVADPLGANVLTLCTGTRDPGYMWRNHPDNATPDAWADLLATMEQAVQIAADSGIVLGVEPEVSNVVSSPQKARQLLDSMASPNLKIIMDGANVFPSGTLDRQHEILDAAFDLLGDDIVLAHAKDISRDGEAGHEAAGTGLLDYDYYIRLLNQSSYDGALVLHSLSEAQTPGCVAFLHEKLGQTA